METIIPNGHNELGEVASERHLQVTEIPSRNDGTGVNRFGKGLVWLGGKRRNY